MFPLLVAYLICLQTASNMPVVVVTLLASKTFAIWINIHKLSCNDDTLPYLFFIGFKLIVILACNFAHCMRPIHLTEFLQASLAP